MDTDKRYSIRKSVALDILINYDLSYPRLWKTRNLSTDGAFVICQRGDLPLAALVEAVLVLRYHDEYEPHRLPAQIVRHGHDGVGIKFGDYANRTFIALENLLGNV
ncbi:MAG TPA: PilZ domain-containing protein [Acidiferrobacterales bacterium]|jgi:hypothetical protein